MKALMISALFLLAAFEIVAQQPCGIYATKEDFLADKVTYSFDNCDMVVKLNKDIVGKHDSHKLRFKYDFVYGYFDGKSKYRAFGSRSPWTNHGFYKVIYEKDIVVYERVMKDLRSNTYVFYYYSASKDSPIVPLKPRFYSYSYKHGGKKGALQINTARLKRHIGLPVDDNEAVARVEVHTPNHF